MKTIGALVLCASLMPISVLATDTLPSDVNAAYSAAGMVKKNGHWTGCPEDNYGMASIEDGGYRDLNGDGVKDLVITDTGTFCYGGDEQGFVLLTKTSGKWTQVYASPGIPTFLPTKTKTPAGWPDFVLGGQGICFPVMRWNGKIYVLNRKQSDTGGRC